MLLSDCLRVTWHHNVASFRLLVLYDAVFCVIVLRSITDSEGKCHTFGSDIRNTRQGTDSVEAQLIFSATPKSHNKMVFISCTEHMQRAAYLYARALQT